ncbi:MAG: hypothetical protein ACI828_001587 [Flavobacteriales bacterium]|jgi:hypothetical protein
MLVKFTSAPWRVLLLLCCFSMTTLVAQENQIVQNELQKRVSLGELTTSDITDWGIISEHVSRTSGVHHIYYRQQIDGIQIYGAEASVHQAQNGRMVASHSSFIKNAKDYVFGNRTPQLNAIQAVDRAAQQLGLGGASARVVTTSNDVARTTVLDASSISRSPIPAKLMYHYAEKGGMRLAWDLSIESIATVNWWNVRIDATTGELLDKVDWTVQCYSEEDHVHDLSAAPKVSAAVEDTRCIEDDEAEAAFMGNYEVYAMPLESPAHGTMNRTIVANPDNGSAIGSPFGWHDTNGVIGNEFTTTRGNNVNAYEDGDNSGYAPDGGANLDFTIANPLEDFSVNTTYSATTQSEAAAVTNIFYWSNIIHDLFYVYGLDEAAGNFQENNYGNGGAGNDALRAEAQDGSGSCNANMSTPGDGGSPRMQMYTCNSRDGDFDNGVVVHEYGHGISIRLTGGAGNSGCLSGAEQMGEGWSDWFALIMTIEAGDTGADARGIGTWLFGQAPSGGGIRPQPYSTDQAVNSQSYDNIITATPPHGVGSVWSTILWEVTWALIDDHGIDSDIYNFSGDTVQDAGNVQALALVVEGLKLQPCGPGFIDGRDAIIAADEAIYGGANYCTLWEAFASRGLGFYADQGSSSSQTDNSENYDPPTLTLETATSICLGETAQVFAGAFPDGGSFSGPGVTDTADGMTYTFDPAAAGIGMHTITYTIPAPLCSDTATTVTATIEVTSDTPEIVCQAATVDLDINGDATIVVADVVTNLLPADYVIDQTGAFVPIDISVVGTTFNLSDEQVSSALPIGFAFDFYNTDFTSFFVSANGFMTFTSPGNAYCCSGQSIPSTGGLNNYIAFAWGDLNPGAGGTLRYATVGSAPNRVLVLEFNEVPFYGTSNLVTSQVHLFEGDSRVEIHSEAIPASGPVTQGIENAAGDSGIATPGRNSQSFSTNNDAVAFYYGVPPSAQNCGTDTTITLSQSAFTCADLGDNDVTITVTDGNGNINTCVATVTVNTGLASVEPIAVCQSITVQLDVDGVANITTSDIDNGSTLCGGGVPVLSADITSFGCGDIGDNTVTLTVSDGMGMSVTCTATVTVEDMIAPNVVCQNITVQLDINGVATITAADVDNGSSDFCGVATTAIDVTSFDCNSLGVNTVQLTVTDINGNAAVCNATVTVEDVAAPTVVCQNITVALDAAGVATITAADLDNGSSDNCAIDTLVVDITSFGCDDLGANTVILTVTDVNGNPASCTAIVTVEDNIDLIVNGPGDLTEETTNTDTTCETVVLYDPITATDNCGQSQITIVQTAGLGSGAIFPIGTTTETYDITDANGVVTTYSFEIEVTDGTNPEVTNCPGNTTEIVDAGQAFVIPDYTTQVTATDNCTALPAMIQVPLPGVELIAGSSTSITITVVDDAGNETLCSFTLSVEDTLSLADEQLSNALAVYPNPVLDMVTVDYSGSDALYSIGIYDVTGKRLAVLNTPEALTTISMKDYAAGIYFVQLTSDKASTVKRLIKK